MRANTAKRALRVIAILLVVQAALAFLMVYSSYKPSPHDLPVGYVGPQAGEAALASKAGSAVDFRTYSSEQAARDAIDQREIYGAVIASNSDRHLLVASAASPAVAQLLREAIAAPRTEIPVTDVAPLSSDDPRGSTINLLVLPLISISLAAVVALGTLRLRKTALLGALALFSLLGGIGVMSVVGLGLGALPGSFFALAGVMALTILAITFPTAGLNALLGKAGVPLAALLFLFIGSPASGNASAAEMLPGFWRQIGQFMPLGASGSGIRNTTYFHGNALVGPLFVLSAYVVGGAALLAVAGLRRRHAEASAEIAPEPALARAA